MAKLPTPPALLSILHVPCSCPFFSLTFYTLQFLSLLILIPLFFFSLPCPFSSIIQSTTIWKAISHSLSSISFLSTYLHSFGHLYYLELQKWIKLMKSRELTKKEKCQHFFIHENTSVTIFPGTHQECLFANSCHWRIKTLWSRWCWIWCWKQNVQSKITFLVLTDGTFFSSLVFFLKNIHF